ncbi:MAG: dephospho-CoA kinase [Candidatus Limnocylindria bacterium]
MSAVRIGITGPIGCGKSTAAGWLGERPGVVVVDADVVARDVLARGTAELDAVYARFGRSLARPDGSLDRAALGRIVFADPVALRELEAIVHPAVRPRIAARLEAADAAGAPAVVIEAIKLVEGGLAELCDEVWLVTCAAEAQLERLVARGSDPGDAAARIAAQGDLARRLAPHAARVLDTSGDRIAARAAVEAALDAALEAARGRAG